MASTASYPTHTKGTVEVFYGTGAQIAQHALRAFRLLRGAGHQRGGHARTPTGQRGEEPHALHGLWRALVFQWQEGAWSDERGYPTTGTFHEQRLVAANTEFQPTTLWGSVLDAYLKFKDGDKDDESYTYTIQ